MTLLFHSTDAGAYRVIQPQLKAEREKRKLKFRPTLLDNDTRALRKLARVLPEVLSRC